MKKPRAGNSGHGTMERVKLYFTSNDNPASLCIKTAKSGGFTNFDIGIFEESLDFFFDRKCHCKAVTVIDYYLAASVSGFLHVIDDGIDGISLAPCLIGRLELAPFGEDAHVPSSSRLR